MHAWRRGSVLEPCAVGIEDRVGLYAWAFDAFALAAYTVAGLCPLDGTEACCRGGGMRVGTGSNAAGSSRYSRKTRAIVAAW